jgi:hypothetical protein
LLTLKEGSQPRIVIIEHDCWVDVEKSWQWRLGADVRA